MTMWRVTMRTAPGVWSMVTVVAANHTQAIDWARALIGGVFSRIDEEPQRWHPRA